MEYKVEQATLRNDLKKYKRALLEAERNVAKMAEEIKNTRNSTDPSFVCPLEHGMSEEEAAMLRAAQDEAEEYKNEVMFAKQEIENLKRELWEVKREKQELENSSPEDIVHLENQIDELKGQKEDLEMENNNLKEEVGQKDDEIVLLLFNIAYFRIFCKIDLPNSKRKLRTSNLEESAQQMTMNWLSNCRNLRRKSDISTRYYYPPLN